MPKRSFTLLEVLVVIIIIGILAAVALPNYGRIQERARAKEAIANLKLIAAAERIYRMEYTNYYPASGTVTDINNINTNLKLSLIGTNWSHAIATTSANPPTFSITADRVTGSYENCLYTLTNTEADGEPNPNASCP